MTAALKHMSGYTGTMNRSSLWACALRIPSHTYTGASRSPSRRKFDDVPGSRCARSPSRFRSMRCVTARAGSAARASGVSTLKLSSRFMR